IPISHTPPDTASTASPSGTSSEFTLTSRSQYRSLEEASPQSGTPQSVLEVALAAYGASAGNLLGAWGETVQYLGRQPTGTRRLLLEALPGLYRQLPVGTGHRLGLLHLCVVLSRNTGLDVMVAE
ncbi:hypothetical protein ACIQB5_51780, partial [Streptomyces sp. NPDC088560]|uniref:hypothetical protein n=1 Tax=Streptomyces sp. NPDC088560 TaxID=3365868 RepID=UPI003820F2DF